MVINNTLKWTWRTIGIRPSAETFKGLDLCQRSSWRSIGTGVGSWCQRLKSASVFPMISTEADCSTELRMKNKDRCLIYAFIFHTVHMHVLLLHDCCYRICYRKVFVIDRVDALMLCWVKSCFIYKRQSYILRKPARYMEAPDSIM